MIATLTLLPLNGIADHFYFYQRAKVGWMLKAVGGRQKNWFRLCKERFSEIFAQTFVSCVGGSDDRGRCIFDMFAENKSKCLPTHTDLLQRGSFQ
jgi:hypothetical protein